MHPVTPWLQNNLIEKEDEEPLLGFPKVLVFFEEEMDFYRP